jgi:hypothetical protein
MFRENKYAQQEVMKRIPKLIRSLMKKRFLLWEGGRINTHCPTSAPANIARNFNY